MKRRNMQELWDIMKRPNLQIVGIDGLKIPSNNMDKILKRIIGNFSQNKGNTYSYP